MKKRPKIIFGSERSGIEITYTKTRKSLYVFGWYDTCTGIEGGEISLEHFLDRLGIPTKDLEAVLQNRKEKQKR